MLAEGGRPAADEVFIDLEDSVALRDKTDETRQNVVDALHAENWLAKTRVVRINGVSTRWWFAIWSTWSSVPGGFSTASSFRRSRTHRTSMPSTTSSPSSKPSWESNSRSGSRFRSSRPEDWSRSRIARASRRVETLIFGPGDFAASTGIPQLSIGAIDADYPADQWHYVLVRIVVTARAFGLQAIDGPYAQIRDGEGFAEIARRSRQLGFDGKWVVHPDQIESCNRIYSPTQGEYERAERTLEALAEAEERHLGAVMFEGEMIDEASRKMAESVAAKGRAAGLDRP